MKVPVKSNGWWVCWALLDDDQFQLATYRWTLDNYGYVRARPKHGLQLKIHRVVLGLEKGHPGHVDHINGDKLDNRRENLRVVTPGQNMQNLPAQRGVRGVSFLKGRAKPWLAEARLQGQRHYLGFYATEREAAEVMRAWYAEYMPFSNPDRHGTPA